MDLKNNFQEEIDGGLTTDNNEVKLEKKLS